jgi:hypothetical protein
MAFDGDLKLYLRAPAPVIETLEQRIIREARALIENPENWVQGAYQHGSAYCLVGALRRAHFGNALSDEICPAERFVVDVVKHVAGTDAIETFNDEDAKHGDALAALDLAYDLAAA